MTGQTKKIFKVKFEGEEEFHGRYKATQPKQAANKALSQYYRKHPKTKKRLEFTIKESTRKCDKKEYTYVGQRVRLKPPVETTIAGKTIVRKFKNVIEIAK